jgi:hypothetical protein
VCTIANRVSEASQCLGRRRAIIHALGPELFGPEVEVQADLFVSVLQQTFARLREAKEMADAGGKGSRLLFHGIIEARVEQ